MNNDKQFSDEDECAYCGDFSNEPSYYKWHQPYSHEPGCWVCEDCYNEQPWK